MERHIRWLEREVLVLMALGIAVTVDAVVTAILLGRVLGVF